MIGWLKALSIDNDYSDDLLSTHPKIRIINQCTPNIMQKISELNGNNTVASLTFCGCLTAEHIPVLNAAVTTMPALKVLRFIDIDVAIWSLLNPALSKTLSVFVGTSNPELSLRRVWKLPGRK